jgi:hypothetical protein
MEPTTMYLAIAAIVLIGLFAWYHMTTRTQDPVPKGLSEVLSELDALEKEFDAIESEDIEAFTSIECSDFEFASKIKTIETLHDRAIGIIEGVASVDNLITARDLFRQVRQMIRCAQAEIRSQKSKGQRPAMRRSLKAVARVAKNKAKRSRNMIRRRLNEQTPGWRATIPK